MAKNILHELQSNRPFFSGVEQKIADVILADPRTFVTYSMKELSELAEVSQGSIMNFFNKFAEGGYPTLKLKVMEGLSGFEQPFSVITGEDDLKRVLEKTADGCMQALTHTIHLNDEETIRRVTDRILRANKVEICGIFQSALVATAFYNQLLQLGIPASFVGDVLTCAISASMLDRNSVMADCGFTSAYDEWRHVAKDNMKLSYGLRGYMIDRFCQKKINTNSKEITTITAMQKTQIPILFIHGTDDKFVPIRMTYENYKACNATKEFLVVPGATHGQSYYAEQEKYELATKNFWTAYDFKPQ